VSRFNRLLERFFYHPEEEGTEGLDASLGPETSATSEAGESTDYYLAFGLETQSYALPIHEVREIVRVRALTEVPGGPKDVIGILNLRGDILPVYNVKPRLRLSAITPPIAGPAADLNAISKAARILVVHARNCDCGIFVDRVIGVVRLRPSEIESPSSGFENERDCVLGFVHLDDSVVMLLNLNLVIE